MRTVRFLAAIALLISVSAYADSASHRRSAERLMELFNVPTTTQLAVQAIVEQQAATNPGVGAFSDAFRSFAAQYLSWDALKGPILEVYVEEFNEEDLRQLVAFFETPVGRKFVERSPVVAEKVGQRVEKILADRQVELRRLIAEQELKALGTGPVR